MNGQREGMTVLAIISALIVGGLSFPTTIYCGNLEPSAPPKSTMKTLDQIPPTWSQKLQCDLFGHLVVCPRFELVMGGYAVLDKETGLVWEQAPGPAVWEWEKAKFWCYEKGVGGRKGYRLPTIEELASLVDPQSISAHSLPSGHPFDGVEDGGYWSSTTSGKRILERQGFEYIYLCFNCISKVFSAGPTDLLHVWCVRGGYGHNGY
jgi:hypothetical protein